MLFKATTFHFSYFNTVKANYLEERELIELARNIPFDDRVNNHAEIADMRSSLLSEYLHAVESELYEGSLSRTVEEVATDKLFYIHQPVCRINNLNSLILPYWLICPGNDHFRIGILDSQ